MLRILLIDHPVIKRNDRASAHLAARGHRVVWSCPGRDEPLPNIEDFDAMIVYGGAEMLSTDLQRPETAYLNREVEAVQRWLERDRPFLGFCLGGQILAAALGGEVGPHPEGISQIGYYPVEPTEGAGDFLAETTLMYQWHQEGFELPPGAQRIATGPDFPNQAIRAGKAFGLQFHPEVDASHYSNWIAQVPDYLERPGAQPVEDQLALAPTHDPITAAWLEAFLDRWLAQ